MGTPRALEATLFSVTCHCGVKGENVPKQGYVERQGLKETADTDCACPLDTVADFSETVSYGWDVRSALVYYLISLFPKVGVLPLMFCRLVSACQKSHWGFFLVQEEPSFSPGSLEFLLLLT